MIRAKLKCDVRVSQGIANLWQCTVSGQLGRFSIVRAGMNNETRLKPLTALLMLPGIAAANAQSTNSPSASANVTNAPTQLPQVTVRGQQDSYKPEAPASPKYAEPLRDIPQTITVIPKSVMDAQGATTLSEVMRNVPGVTMLAGEGGGASSTAGDSFYMRGFDATSSIFVDGVRNQGLITRDTFNLEQVEVFKGPTGSDVGRGTASGYVNLSTKSPTLAPLYSGTAGYNSGDTKRLTGDFNQPLPFGGSNSWFNGTAFRLNGVWQDGGVAGRDHVERETEAIAPSLALGLGTPTRIIVSSEHTWQNNLPDYGLPAAALTNSIVKRDNFYGILGYDKEEVTQNNYLARIEHDLTANITLRNQTSYSETERFAIITSITGGISPTNTVNRSRQINDRENKIFSNQSSVNANFSTGPLEHKLVGGVEYSWEEETRPSWTGQGSASPADATNPNPHDPVTGYDPHKTGAYTKGSTASVAFYAFDTMEIGKHWILNGGFRWEHFDLDYKSVATNGVPVSGTPLHADDNLLSWKAGIVFKPIENGSIYASISTTLTPPGAGNQNLSTNVTGNNLLNNPATKPQESENYELGTKWDFFKNRLSVNTAFFYTINRNEATRDSVTDEIIYDRERIVYGIEAGVAGKITKNWQVFGNMSWLHSEFSDPSSTSGTDGATLQWTPEWSASLWTTYRFPFGLTIGGGARYMSVVQRSTTTTPNGSTPEMPDYWVLDAMAQYEFNQHFSLRLNVFNLTDEFYSASLNNNGQRFNPGPPLSAMLTATIKF